MVLMFFWILPLKAQEFPYRDSTLKTEQRVEDLLQRMNPEEKFWQLYMIPGDLSEGKERYRYGIFGFQVAAAPEQQNANTQRMHYSPGLSARADAEKKNDIQRYIITQSRLGIPVIFFDEALHGLIREGATVFPQSIGLAATWDTVLMHQVAGAIALESRSRGIRQILSPVLNLSRDIRWGRTEETYGEDPLLVSLMGGIYVEEMQKAGIVATPKHFAVNSGDGGRDSYPVALNDRELAEKDLLPFEYAICHKQAGSVMTAYNSLDGSPCSANNALLNKKLKQEWGFRGFVISDAGGTGGANVLHFTAADYTEATANALNNGLDVIFQTSYDHYPLFYKAFQEGRISSGVVDNAVRRVLRAKFDLGLFDAPYIDPVLAEKVNHCPEHRSLALKAAQESVVLLKNESQVLPIRKDVQKIAVIGKDAAIASLGGYSGPGVDNISILEGLTNKFKGLKEVVYAEGCGHFSTQAVPIPDSCLFYETGGQVKQGLQAFYFSNITLSGTPALTRTDPKIDFAWTLFSPEPSLAYDWYSVRWNGLLKAPVTGTFRLGMEGNDGYRIYINDELFIDRWYKQSYSTQLKEFYFEKGKYYKIRVEYFESAGNARIRLLWDAGLENEWKEQLSEAVSLAAGADLSVIVAGIEEGEFRDRALLELPGHQEELIKAVAATGKPVVVVLTCGSPVTMDHWMEDADAILMAWYPGEEGGDAVADVLSGDYNPAGRLPVTWPVNVGQLPLVYNHKPTGRGDDYVNLTGQPLFPFGFGLSYTTFRYEDLQLSQARCGVHDTCTLSFRLTNSGTTEGDEVVQLYLHDEVASVARPVTELKGFQRVHLKAGESRIITFKLLPSMFEMLDVQMKPVIEPGQFRIMIGSSCKDIRLREMIELL